MVRPENLAAAPVGTIGERTYSYVVTAVNRDTLEESLPTSPVEVVAASTLNVEDP